MTDIRYVILSDLHFGAENSVLTSLNERPASAGGTGFSADPQRPSPLLSGLIDGLRELTRGQDRPPTLILAGDILDLALSPDEVCAMVFRLFAHLAVRATARPRSTRSSTTCRATTTTTSGRSRGKTST